MGVVQASGNGAAVRRLTVEQLHADTAGDVMVISETHGGAIAAWRLNDGFAFAAADEYSGAECWLHVIGDPGSTPALVDSALDELGERVAGLTVPRGVSLATWNAEPPPGEQSDSDWDLMASYAAPPQFPAEERVAAIEDLAQVQAFLDRVSPHHSVKAEDPLVDLWAGVRDEPSGDVIALGALTRQPSGVAYLASIATDPAARGQGFGAAVTSVLTRTVFERGEPLCTLAHYHPNEVARRIYLRIGYQTTHRFSSGHIRR